MRPIPPAIFLGLLIGWGHSTSPSHADESRPLAQDEQPGGKMHIAMEDLPTITVGRSDAEIIGSDNRALQAAVDYVANLGGGVVRIGPGEYEMRDSLHLRTNVHVSGAPGKTILKKAQAAASKLKLDGDFGEEQITLENAAGFRVGDGVAIWDKSSGGFHTTVARIVGRKGNAFAIDRPLNADCMVANGAEAATVFPVISGYDATNCVVEHLIIEGNKNENPYLNGCRGAGIFLIRSPNTVIRHCTIRNYHGDGISFQQSNDVVVEDCESFGNSNLGFHPGSGSQRPQVRRCVARKNGEDGLFLCWRVKRGLFEDNILDGNGRYGISIGHKDTDNLFRRNHILKNNEAGVFFRRESEGMAGHRNRFEENRLENNGGPAAVIVAGATQGVELHKNVIQHAAKENASAVRLEDTAGNVALSENQIDAQAELVDARKSDKK